MVETTPAVRFGGGLVYNFATGELVALDAPTDKLAQTLADIRELEADLRADKLRLSEELHKRMDAEAKWTARVGDYELRGESPQRVAYDGCKLMDALERLHIEGHISEEAMDAAIQEVTEFRPKVRGVQALLKLGGVVEERIRETEIPVETPRRIQVRRKA